MAIRYGDVSKARAIKHAGKPLPIPAPILDCDTWPILESADIDAAQDDAIALPNEAIAAIQETIQAARKPKARPKGQDATRRKTTRATPAKPQSPAIAEGRADKPQAAMPDQGGEGLERARLPLASLPRKKDGASDATNAPPATNSATNTPATNGEGATNRRATNGAGNRRLTDPDAYRAYQRDLMRRRRAARSGKAQTFSESQ